MVAEIGKTVTLETDMVPVAEGDGGASGHSKEGPAPPNEAQAETAALFPIGTVVIGHSTKWKSSYNNVQCKFVACLTKKYRVQMLEGDSAGDNHNYEFW